MKFSILACFLIIAATALAQINPGGVSRPEKWIVTKLNNNRFQLIDRANNDIIIFGKNNLSIDSSLNLNSAFAFSKENRVVISLKPALAKSSTIFSTYKIKDSLSEYIIWFAEKNKKTGLVFTQKRMADLSDFSYFNFKDKMPLNPKAGVLVQHSSDTTAVDSLYLNIGATPGDIVLPVQSFSGLLPELIIYDRVLSHDERLKILSYLCLKYGITLTDAEANYVNSKDEIIWDGNKYPLYHNNIAGLIRDDSSGINITSAQSSNQIPIVKFSLTGSLTNLNSLIWGDNNLQPVFLDKKQGFPSYLQREYLVKYNLNQDSAWTTLYVSADQMDAPAKGLPQYWIAVDENEEGDFQPAATNFYKLQAGNKPNQLFAAVKWRKNTNGINRFRIVRGDRLLLVAEADLPLCDNSILGKLRMRVWATAYPCTVKVFDETNTLVFTDKVFNSNIFIADQLKAGTYRIETTDNWGHKILENYTVSNADFPYSFQLDEQYPLQVGRSLMLDASPGMDNRTSFVWTGPENFISKGSKVSIPSPGVYTIEAGKDGCRIFRHIQVTNTATGTISDIVVYPNPSSTGNFNAQVTLDRTGPLSMTIFSSDGKLIQTQNFPAAMFHNIQGHIKENGVYILHFKSGLSEQTSKIVILQ